MQSRNEMKPKKIMAAAMALLLGLTAVPTAWAVTEEPGGQKVPDYIYYRSRPKDTFDGEIDIRRSGGGAVTGVTLQSDPILHLTEFDDAVQRFDSLFTSGTLLLDIQREGGTDQVEAGMAVYDRMELVKGTGSVSLTVKDNRSLMPIVGAEYNLYQGGDLLEEGLVSDGSGNVTVSELKEGNYTLRQSRVPTGYVKTDTPVPFTIGGVELLGGETQIKTTSGRTIRADSGEVLLGGVFSPDITLKATNEKQITSVTATFEGVGSKLDEEGRLVYGSSQKQLYSSVKEAQDAINEAKNRGEICGAVKLTYSLTGDGSKATCKFTQYVGAVIQEETPAPTPVPTRAPTQRPEPTAAPTIAPTEKPVRTNAPTNTPIPKPSASPAVKSGKLTILASTDTGKASGFVFDIVGLKTDGTAYTQSPKTDAAGEIVCVVPDGTYTVGLKENSSANQGVSLPERQNVTISGGEATYLSFSLVLTERELVLTVVDDDGLPLENVVVGIFHPIAENHAGERASRSAESSATDVSKELTLREQEIEMEKRKENPYDKRNALDTDTSDKDGVTTFPAMPVTQLLAVVLEAPEGYVADGKAMMISEGADGKFELLCQYVQVDITVTGESTGKPVLGAMATLTDQEGKKVVSWEINDEPHSLIRVPAGKYGLLVTYSDQEDSFTLDVTQAEIKQFASLTSYLTGNAPIERPKGEQGMDVQKVILIAICTIAGGALLTCGILLWRKRRKRTGGYQ